MIEKRNIEGYQPRERSDKRPIGPPPSGEPRMERTMSEQQHRHRFCKDCRFCEIEIARIETWLCTVHEVKKLNPQYLLDGEFYAEDPRRPCMEAREDTSLCGHGARYFEPKAKSEEESE